MESKKNRKENSLGLLTIKFIDMIVKSGDQLSVDLKVAANQLGVEKRRVYDITNVLEGINFLKRSKKNIVTWNKDKIEHLMFFHKNTRGKINQLNHEGLDSKTLS